jgi:hypothetical protein
MAFWRMLKQGYDHFEITRHEPKVDVCEKRYVFDAETNSRFSAADKCPAYRVPEQIASLVRDKQRRDDTHIAELANRVPAAPIKTGVDGGMNPVFLTALKRKDGLFDNNGRFLGVETTAKLPGTIPAHVNPPRDPGETTGSTFALASSDARTVQVASAGPSQSSGFFGNLFSFGRSEPAPPPAPAQANLPKPKANPPATKPAPAPTMTAAAKPKTEPAQTPTRSANAGAIKPQQQQQQQQQQQADSYAEPAKPSNNATTLSGAAPTVPSGGFENRFGGWR